MVVVVAALGRKLEKCCQRLQLHNRNLQHTWNRREHSVVPILGEDPGNAPILKSAIASIVNSPGIEDPDFVALGTGRVYQVQFHMSMDTIDDVDFSILIMEDGHVGVRVLGSDIGTHHLGEVALLFVLGVVDSLEDLDNVIDSCLRFT